MRLLKIADPPLQRMSRRPMPLAQQPNNIVFPPVDAFPDCDFRTAPRFHSISSSARLLRSPGEPPRRPPPAKKRDECAALVAVVTCVSSHAPRTEPYVRLSRIWLPPRVYDGESGRIRSSAFVTRAWLWVQYVLC